MRRMILGVLASAYLAVSPALLSAEEKFVPNYDESKVPAYTLPDPHVTPDGKKVTTVSEWETEQRINLKRLFENEMFGKSLGSSGKEHWKLVEENAKAMDGQAHRIQIEYAPGGPDRGYRILIYLPAAATKPVPVFVTMNFLGNHTINTDEDVPVASWLSPDPSTGQYKTITSEIERGNQSRRFPIELILKRGYGIATVHYQAVYPDDAKVAIPSETNEPAAISRWSRGYTEITDVVSQLPQIDPKKIIFLGHSRLGKTALWAGANDPRAAIVISNDSGCGGASIARRQYGETVERINTAFPHWFCGNYKKYSKAVNELPFDSHELLSLIAPRPVYVASATEDQWADPKGEFLALMHANPVYNLYGLEGIRETEQPAPEVPISAHNGYHLRVGKHDILEYDWDRYLDFADGHFKK